jgi:hypothetical protein
LATAEEQVGRFDVPVDDAQGVGGGQRLSCAAHELQSLREREGLSRQTPGEILSLQPLHGQEGLALPREAMSHIRDDAGVAELRQQFGLPLEAADRRGMG